MTANPVELIGGMSDLSRRLQYPVERIRRLVIRQIGKRRFDFVSIPYYSPVDPLWSGHASILDHFVELGCANTDVACGFLSREAAWRVVERVDGLAGHGSDLH